MEANINTWFLGALTLAFAIFKYFDIRTENRRRDKEKKFFRIIAAMVDKLNHVANQGVSFRDAFMKSATGVDMLLFKQHMNERMAEESEDDKFWRKMITDLFDDKKPNQ